MRSADWPQPRSYFLRAGGGEICRRAVELKSLRVILRSLPDFVGGRRSYLSKFNRFGLETKQNAEDARGR